MCVIDFGSVRCSFINAGINRMVLELARAAGFARVSVFRAPPTGDILRCGVFLRPPVKIQSGISSRPGYAILPLVDLSARKILVFESVVAVSPFPPVRPPLWSFPLRRGKGSTVGMPSSARCRLWEVEWRAIRSSRSAVRGCRVTRSGLETCSALWVNSAPRGVEDRGSGRSRARLL